MPQEKRYSEDQPRDSNGRFGSGDDAGKNIGEGLKGESDKEDFHGIKVGDKVSINDGKTGTVKGVAGNSLTVDTGNKNESWHASKVTTQADAAVVSEHLSEAEKDENHTLAGALKTGQALLSGGHVSKADAKSAAAVLHSYVSESKGEMNRKAESTFSRLAGRLEHFSRPASYGGARSSQQSDKIEDLMKLSMEYRHCAELRAADGDDLKIVGYAAVFNTPSKDLGGFRETVAPGAFTRALEQKQDVKCLFNHSADRVLGRVGNGTLSLVQDERGLRFECQLDANNSDHRNLHAQVKRGDINECSFAFKAGDKGQKWETQKDETGKMYAARTLTDVDLFDVSAVTYPAYNTTSVFARSLTPEVRSAILSLNIPETRNDEEDSYEDCISEVSKALAAAFPGTEEEKAYSCMGGRFWVCETYEDYVIASECGSGEYFRIPYVEVEPDNYKFGTPVQVEKEWVPTERSKKVAEETRAAKASHLASMAGDHAAAAGMHKDMSEAHGDAADSHAAAAQALKEAAEKKAEEERMDSECLSSMGDCAYEKHSCQNVMVEKRDAWRPEDETDEDETDEDETDEAEERAEDGGKVRTKTVDGKALSKKYFAFVGDPNKTETWKLPIPDADHVRNALARFGQTEGLGDNKAAVLANIRRAAKKFGIDVSDQRSLFESILPMDEEEVADTLLRLEVAMRK